MHRNLMRFTLLAALIGASATEVSVPALSTPAIPSRIAEAEASIPRGTCAASQSSWTVTVRQREAARAIGCTGPADHPRPPLGHFKLTAYSGPQRGGAYPITASGTSVRAGRTVAVDPKVIPLGSRIYIEGIGERIAEDIGGAVKGHHIDVYVPTVPQARKFGVRGATVTVIGAPEDLG